jgi:antirestriction protein ArdC
MAKTKPAAKPAAEKSDVYDVINDRILALLDKGVVPWKKSWSARGGAEGLPRNVEGRRYNGMNAFLLDARMTAEGWNDPRFLTFKKGQEMGGMVRKGEKGTPVVYWTFLKKDETDDTGKTKTKRIPFLKYYTVFNVAQFDNLNVKPLPVREPVAEWEGVEAAEQVIANMPNRPAFDHKGRDRAYYIPALDSVHVPAREDFTSAGGYYETIFHEFSHSTGHSSRLNRKNADQPAHFGSEPYAREELVAEFGAAFLMAEVGLDSDESVENMAAYIASWKRAVAEDRKALVVAAGQAQKAADYILGRLDASMYEDGEAMAA